MIEIGLGWAMVVNGFCEDQLLPEIERRVQLLVEFDLVFLST